jgi:hypothetical protein
MASMNEVIDEFFSFLRESLFDEQKYGFCIFWTV